MARERKTFGTCEVCGRKLRQHGLMCAYHRHDYEDMKRRLAKQGITDHKSILAATKEMVKNGRKRIATGRKPKYLKVVCRKDVQTPAGIL